VVLSKQFAKLSVERFTFFGVDLPEVDELMGREREQIKTLISDNEITTTPTLLFLDAKTLKQKHLHRGHQDLEPALVVKKISDALKR